jgi:hypothetical protein
MLRTSLAVIGFALLAGCAQVEQPDRAVADASDFVVPVVSDATSESDAIQLDQNTQPSSPDALQHQSQPSDNMGPAEQGQMQESDDINN